MTKILNTSFIGSQNRKSLLRIYYPDKLDNAPILLFAHGFKGFKDWGHFPLIQQSFADAGFIIVAFNFSHNGGTVENPIDFPDLEAFSENTYLKEVADVGFVLDWISERKHDYFLAANINHISLLGHSRGGGISLLAAYKFEAIKKVVTWAAVADFVERLPSETELEEWKNTGVYHLKNGRTNQEMPMKYEFVESLLKNKDELNIESAVRNSKKPILLMHGVNDETVALENAQRIQSWNNKVQLVALGNCNHTFNGKHPWVEAQLPEVTKQAIKATALFLNS